MKKERDCYEDQDDATLVASVMAGEREAFDILLLRYSQSVLRLCTTLLGNTIEAQDITQEASLQAFLGLSRLREPARFASWFHTIAANLARSALRRHHEFSLHTPATLGLDETTISRAASPHYGANESGSTGWKECSGDRCRARHFSAAIVRY